jgi:hypothetical protein
LFECIVEFKTVSTIKPKLDSLRVGAVVVSLKPKFITLFLLELFPTLVGDYGTQNDDVPSAILAVSYVCGAFIIFYACFSSSTWVKLISVVVFY